MFISYTMHYFFRQFFSEKFWHFIYFKQAMTDCLLIRVYGDGALRKHKFCRKIYSGLFSFLEFCGSSYIEMNLWCTLFGSVRYRSI